MKCWSVCDDLEELYGSVLERDMTKDEISNVLLGMKELYHLKFQTLMEGFENVINEYYHPNKTYHGVDEDDSTLD